MKQPWIHSATADTALILGPAFLVTALVLLLGERVEATAETPPLLWLLLIAGIDVGHVWSTAARTYLDRDELHRHPALYVLAPLLGFIGAVVLYRLGEMVFWRALAYLAAFHFVRQQYGFAMIYRRGERAGPAYGKRLDQAVFYAATLYPLIVWHCRPRNFDWFVPGDFLRFDAPGLATAAGWIYLGLLAAYVLKECIHGLRRRFFNAPKNLLVAGTALSWYVGIVAFDNDLAFTATNVVAHGVPYITLIWIYGRNASEMRNSLPAGVGTDPTSLNDLPNRRSLLQEPAAAAVPIGVLFRHRYLPLYLALLFLVAYLEEGLWDGLIWREHGGLFPIFQALPAVESADLLTWLVPMLALPQITHYLLDAFIWRMGGSDDSWRSTLFRQGDTGGSLHARLPAERRSPAATR